MTPRAPGNESTADAAPTSMDPDGYGLLTTCEAGTASHRLSHGKAVVLGRAHTCDVVLDDSSVSREHALIHAGLPPRLEDLGSRNGTLVHGQRLDKGARLPLSIGTVFQLGSAVVIVQRGGASLRRPPSNRPAREGPASAPVVKDATMLRLYGLLDLIGPSDLSVLLLGETGVGKEVFAEILHQRSARAARPFLRINCAALTETLLESELFGHERGAFTGAVQSKTGLFESADGGTVFLDEVGELAPATQAKLLRVLESGDVLRVGSVRPRRVDVRFVSATNRDLESDIAAGKFRSDLFFRLNGIAMTLPPLRERPDDVDALADAFLALADQKAGKRPRSLSMGARAALRAHPWPGNIRELRNTLDRAALLCPRPVIEAEDLTLGRPLGAPLPVTQPAEALRDQMGTFERQRILDALARCNGNQTQAAKLLHISRRSLVGKLAEYKIERPTK